MAERSTTPCWLHLAPSHLPRPPKKQMQLSHISSIMPPPTQRQQYAFMPVTCASKSILMPPIYQNPKPEAEPAVIFSSALIHHFPMQPRIPHRKM
eukprot:scaffold226611_cov24-Attheya_sp.AAC.1